MAMVASTLLVPITGNASIATTTVIAHWSCDETSGTRYDSSDNNNDLTDNNTVTYEAGKISNACVFARANSEYLSITDAAQTGLDFTTDVTFSFWIKKAGDDDGLQGLFMKDVNGANNTRSYNVWYNDSGSGNTIEIAQYPTGFSGANEYGGQYSRAFTDATWEHIVLTLDRDVAGTGNNKFYLYVNGVGQGYFTWTSGSGAVSFQNTATGFAIGYGAGGWITGFDGSLDDITIFNNIINSDEVSQLYNAGSGLTWPFSTSTTATTSTSTASTTSTVDVEELKWVLELYLSVFTFLIFTYVGYRFTKMFI